MSEEGHGGHTKYPRAPQQDTDGTLEGGGEGCFMKVQAGFQETISEGGGSRVASKRSCSNGWNSGSCGAGYTSPVAVGAGTGPPPTHRWVGGNQNIK